MVTFYKPQKKEVEKKAIKVNCTDLDLQGRGVARDDKYVYFVEGLMPGDSANVLISNVKGKIATGKITKIIKQSEKRLKKGCVLDRDNSWKLAKLKMVQIQVNAPVPLRK